MIELINNTFQILAGVANSKAAILLKINNFEFSVISFAGSDPNIFNEFNNEIFEHHKSSGIISEDSVLNLPFYNSILKNLNAKSCFFRTVYSLNEQNESVYLFLFGDEANLLAGSLKDTLTAIIGILSTQIKEFYYTSKNVDTELVSKTNIDENSVTKNWEDNFESLLKISNDLIFFLDKNGCFVKVNTACSMILDYTEKEMVGKHILDFVPSENKVNVSEEINELLRSGKTKSINTLLRSKLDKKIMFEINCKTIIKNNEVVGMLGIASDISKLKKYEEELLKLKPKLIEAQRLISIERSRVWQQTSIIEELDRLKSEFVSNISHEFRTPLASIIGFSETIVSDPDLPQEMKSEFSHVILNEGKRLAKLINDVLDLSNIEGGKVTLNKVSLDVVELIREVVNINLESAERKRIALEYEHPMEEVIIEADKEKLAQSFEALINNAIKFTNEDGRVKVIIRNFLKEIEIIITDTGVGIPKKDLPYIFQKFYRVSRPGTEIPGTGIGLVFVKQMIDLHKGIITVHSEVGNGTTFSVKFLKSFKSKN